MDISGKVFILLENLAINMRLKEFSNGIIAMLCKNEWDLSKGLLFTQLNFLKGIISYLGQLHDYVYTFRCDESLT